MPGPEPDLLNLMLARIHAAILGRQDLLVVGLCGAQGSGKSTLCRALKDRLDAEGVPAAALSLDDLYLTRRERQALAAAIHPLLITRGVPGTHDVALGLETIDALTLGAAAALPRFDKGIDDRAPKSDWPLVPAGIRVLLFEGWCLGAMAQDDALLIQPVNPLEAMEDPEGIWRRYANAALAGPYRVLFARIDLLILLAAPDWDAVGRWREQAEAQLRSSGAPQAMQPAALARFIQHYERLTRWILTEMPSRADVTIRLDPNRRMLEGPGNAR